MGGSIVLENDPLSVQLERLLVGEHDGRARGNGRGWKHTAKLRDFLHCTETLSRVLVPDYDSARIVYPPVAVRVVKMPVCIDKEACRIANLLSGEFAGKD